MQRLFITLISSLILIKNSRKVAEIIRPFLPLFSQEFCVLFASHHRQCIGSRNVKKNPMLSPFLQLKNNEKKRNILITFPLFFSLTNFRVHQLFSDRFQIFQVFFPARRSLISSDIAKMSRLLFIGSKKFLQTYGYITYIHNNCLCIKFFYGNLK